MIFFCLLWIPLFFAFWRSVSNAEGHGIGWALFLGIVYTTLQYFFGPFIDPGSFGLYRWLGGFVDIVCVPVLIPLVICLLLIAVRALPGNADIGGFILLFLVPLSAFRSMDWYSPGLPIKLILVPVLWTALATGISALFFLARTRPKWYNIILAALVIAVMPFFAATAWWAFYVHQTLIGYVCLITSLIPLTVWVIGKIISKFRETNNIGQITEGILQG